MSRYGGKEGGEGHIRGWEGVNEGVSNVITIQNLTLPLHVIEHHLQFIASTLTAPV